MRRTVLSVVWLFLCPLLYAQTGWWPNGTDTDDHSLYALTNITLVQDYNTTLHNGVLLWQDGRVLASGKDVQLPPAAVQIDGKGAWVYPAFVDVYAPGAGLEPLKMPEKQRGAYAASQSTARAFNDAIRADVRAVSVFTGEGAAMEEYRKLGFGTLLSFVPEGIISGTGVLVRTGRKLPQESILREDAAMFCSFEKPASAQMYPTSLAGAIALLRQTYIDAAWYAKYGFKQETNLALKAMNDHAALPSVMATRDKWDVLRADQLGDEAGLQYIFKGSGTEYQRLAEMKASGGTFILPLQFPEAFDVRNPELTREIWYSQLLHWEMAPYNPAMLFRAGVPFCFTLDGLKEKAQLHSVLRKVEKHGLPAAEVLKAFTYTPAHLMKLEQQAGHLRKGAFADFFILSDNLFNEGSFMYAGIVQGSPVFMRSYPQPALKGSYTLQLGTEKIYTLRVDGMPDKWSASLSDEAGEKSKAGLQYKEPLAELQLKVPGDSLGLYRLSGRLDKDGNLSGTGSDPDGAILVWTARRMADTATVKKEPQANLPDTVPPAVPYPFNAFGHVQAPAAAGKLLIRNVTVWTNTSLGILPAGDVLIDKGVIVAVGSSLPASGAEVLDGSGKHLTCGIIDEHSHIALSRGVNEAGANISAEVRMGDVINPDDINIYRHLAGGVTTVQQLHGSANPIGGQSSVIKLRWGRSAADMQLKGAAGFIKFALGENVKQSNWGGGRYPQTRAGVEQAFEYWFTRALEYEKERNANAATRRDLRLETLLEILHGKRFVTCHSYVQSEINMLMKLALRYGFRINTFTHILEGYKVADKMKEHGAAASTFADWWAYKMEVSEAIPYNASVLNRVGVLTAINSDDAEMGRRLNQEAAKLVKYGNMSEEEAWKTVTLNPARILHLDKRLGSIEKGKDADLVLWSDHPLSIYARVEKTYIDGICYFDRGQHEQQQQTLAAERNRIIQKMLNDGDVKSGKGQKPVKQKEHLYHCDDLEP